MSSKLDEIKARIQAKLNKINQVETKKPDVLVTRENPPQLQKNQPQQQQQNISPQHVKQTNIPQYHIQQTSHDLNKNNQFPASVKQKVQNQADDFNSLSSNAALDQLLAMPMKPVVSSLVLKRKKNKQVEKLLKDTQKPVNKRKSAFYDPAVPSSKSAMNKRRRTAFNFFEKGQDIEEFKKQSKLVAPLVQPPREFIVKNELCYELTEAQLQLGERFTPLNDNEVEWWDQIILEPISTQQEQKPQEKQESNSKIEEDPEPPAKADEDAFFSKDFFNFENRKPIKRQQNKQPEPEKQELANSTQNPTPSGFIFKSDPNASNSWKLKEDLVINLYVEHPIPADPTFEVFIPEVRPPMLTREEKRKARKQRRNEKEQEKQKKIALGLQPPDPPKANLKNFMKVYLSDSAVDPTKLEKKIRSEMEERKQEHVKSNQERKLTKSQKYEKKKKKYADDEKRELCCALFLCTNLTHPQSRFKVKMNSLSMFCTGFCAMSNGMNLILVEGGRKAINKITRVFEERINWQDGDNLTTNPSTEVANPDAQKKENDEHDVEIRENYENYMKQEIPKPEPQAVKEEDVEMQDVNAKTTENSNQNSDALIKAMQITKEKQSSTCKLIWVGTSKKRFFWTFNFKKLDTLERFKNFLKSNGFLNAYDICKFEYDRTL